MVNKQHLEHGIVRVGIDGGRGFVVQGQYEERYVITAAHCLGDVPDHVLKVEDELVGIGPLAEPDKHISASVYVWDVARDLAVLGCPDDQTFFDEADAYQAFVGGCVALDVDLEVPPYPPDCGLPFVMYTSDNLWVEGVASTVGMYMTGIVLGIGIPGGTSGSPIFRADDGAAFGLVTTGQLTEGGELEPVETAQIHLGDNLPGWMLRSLKKTLEP
ncbi:MAG: trypsin-like peptidase domain-containing protein [Gammaproteobacteria bacterium]